jgi:predicted PolB exonuclease-like 3'-5' exonuclease
MTSEQLTAILLAAIAAPGFWEVIKTMIDKLLQRKRVTIEQISEKLDAQGKKLNSLEEAFNKKNTEDLEKEAKAARRRILRTDDEIRIGVKHSKDYFDDVLRDIDSYEEYCDDHPHFKNKCAESAINNVLACYETCKADNSFL